MRRSRRDKLWAAQAPAASRKLPAVGHGGRLCVVEEAGGAGAIGGVEAAREEGSANGWLDGCVGDGRVER